MNLIVILHLLALIPVLGVSIYWYLTDNEDDE